MSSYQLNRFLFDLKMNEAVFQQALNNLSETTSRYDLSAEEKEALMAGDPRRLRQLGAHGMLALYIMRLNPDFKTNIYWSQK
ncbi:MAG: hypothetical protein E6J89_08095 [Deltaproteobacteria bacterium]|nr:MAG: hypothetical protein E6J89_08095 [Deltaproteobacteria bacterium]